MRKWELDLPLSKCLEGSVKWIANKETTKPPKWYREFLNTNWDEERKKYINKCKKYAGLFQDANGDKNKESNVLIDFFLNKD